MSYKHRKDLSPVDMAILDFQATYEEYLTMEKDMHDKVMELVKLNKVIIMRMKNSKGKE